MSPRGRLAARSAELAYAGRMASFMASWARAEFGQDAEARCDGMAVDPRGPLRRLDTHALLEDHRARGPAGVRFYLCGFRPTWTDCTCEGYHAEGFGMSAWSEPPPGADAARFCAERNCPTVSHVLAHELLRRAGSRRYVDAVHDVWARHHHDGLPFAAYGPDGGRGGGEDFLTIDASQLRR